MWPEDPRALNLAAALAGIVTKNLDGKELLSILVYGVDDSSGFPADVSLIDSMNKLHTGDDIRELSEAA